MPNTKLLYAILALAVLAIFGGVGYWVSKSQTEQNVTPATTRPSQTIQELTTIAPTADSSAEGLSTADWQTYENREFGFSFRYMKNWTAQAVGKVDKTIVERIILYPTGNQPELEGGPTGDILVDILQNSKNLTLKDFYNEENGQVNLYQNARKGTKAITVGGREASHFSGVGGLLEAYTIVTISYNNLVIEVTDQGEVHQEDGIFNQILSTFQFTN